MSVAIDAHRVEQQSASPAGNMWGAIRCGLDNTAHTLRLYLIMLAATLPSAPFQWRLFIDAPSSLP
jgi:hypothetical protein